MKKPLVGIALETKRKKLEQNLEQLNQDMYKRNLELAETNRTLSLLRKIDTLVLDAHDDLEVLCQNVAEAIVEFSTFPVVAIVANPPKTDQFKMLGLAVAFKDKFDPKQVKFTLDEETPWLSSPEKQTSLNLNSIPDDQIAKQMHISEETVQQWRQQLNINSLVIVKLMSRFRIVGLMAFGFTQLVQNISEKDMAHIERLGEVVGIAIDNKLLFEENQYVLRQIQRTNSKLRALDETKDEFISMASHQLRTPLTSVKGYLSMVLEGDTGKVPDNQRKLLDQAFVSSQRMVYLIADLLNVSRLKTGKFIIEQVACNLAEVVEQEVGQLKEIAKSHNLELNYTKPADFPTYMLDETKIRQVIMNFIDNAIYYTTAGGKIDVVLTNNEKTIDLEVKDSGLGVPKREQAHLFSKFYRADNAKKVRPDGTGLGLFMAKKVIIAQGGSIIFSSVEGKGSTFGFSFDKSKLQVPTETEQTEASSKEQKSSST